MILKRTPTIKSCLALIAVVGATIAASYEPGDPRDLYWALPFWLGPVVLAHFVRSRKRLFYTCLLVSVALQVAVTATFTFLSPESHADYRYRAWQTGDALNLPATVMRFPFLGVWWEDLARSVVSAPIYGLLGAAYSTMCVLRSSDGRPVAEKPLYELAFTFARSHRRALLLLLPPAVAFVSVLYVMHSRRESEIDRLYQRLKDTRYDAPKSLPDVPLHGLRRFLGWDHWFVQTAIGLEGGWTKSDAELLRPFRYLEQVRVDDGQSAEAVLEVIGGLPRLRGLELKLATDAGLKQLHNINSLTYLNLSDTQFTDEGFAVICQGQKLQKLVLNNANQDRNMNEAGPARLTERAICSLTALKALTILVLCDNGLTDNCLRELAKLPHLEALYIGSARLTDTGFSHLSRAGQLKELTYSNPIKLAEEVSPWPAPPRLASLFLPDNTRADEFLFHLRLLEQVTFLRAWGLDRSLAVCLPPQKNIQRLELANSDIDDNDLKAFTNMKQLSFLDIRGTNTTQVGAAKLQIGLPNCEIHW
jgi:hypothetical protein